MNAIMGDFGLVFDDVNVAGKTFQDALVKIGEEALAGGMDVFAGLDNWQQVFNAMAANWQTQMQEQITKSQQTAYWAQYGQYDTRTRENVLGLQATAARTGDISQSEQRVALEPISAAIDKFNDLLEKQATETDPEQLAKMQDEMLKQLELMASAAESLKESAPSIAKFAEYNLGLLEDKYQQSGISDRVGENISALAANTSALYMVAASLGNFISSLSSLLSALAYGAPGQTSVDEVFAAGGMGTTVGNAAAVASGKALGIGAKLGGGSAFRAGGYTPGAGGLIPNRSRGSTAPAGVTYGAATYNDSGEMGYWSENCAADGGG
jgi:hypothetical protein